MRLNKNCELLTNVEIDTSIKNAKDREGGRELRLKQQCSKQHPQTQEHSDGDG